MISSFCYFFLIKISVLWWIKWTNGLNFSSWLAPKAFTTCIFGSLYQKVRYILPCQLNFELVSWLPLANCWQIRGKQRAENVLACLHSPVFAVERVWKSILGDGAREAEQSSPGCLSWGHPRWVDSHTLAGQSHRADGGSQLESEEISSWVQPKLLTHGLVSKPNAYCFKPLQFQTAVCFAEVMDNGGSHLL